MGNEFTDDIDLKQIGKEVAEKYHLQYHTDDSNQDTAKEDSTVVFTLEDGVEHLTFLNSRHSGFDSASLQRNPESNFQLTLTHTYMTSENNIPGKGNSMRAVLPVQSQSIARNLAYGVADFILRQ